MSDPFLDLLQTSFEPLNIKSHIELRISQVKEMIVQDEASYCEITYVYSAARNWQRLIETKRKELCSPYRAQLNAINDKAKEISEPIEMLIAIANQKATAYAELLEERKRIADEEEKKILGAISPEEEFYVEPLPTTIVGNKAMAITKVEKRFKVTDISLVPRKYLVVDEAAIKRDIALGVSSISGIEVWDEKITTLRKR